jgi:hypothetical protein
MSKSEEAKFDEVMKEAGLTAKWEARGRAEGEARGERTAWEKFVSLMEQGDTVDQLKRMAPVSDNR